MSCGNGPDVTAEEGEALMPKRRVLPKTDPKTCVRCRIDRGAYMLRSLPYCKGCFFPSVQQRFLRHIYGPLRPQSSKKNASRPPVQPGQVLVALSGGAGSVAMLDHLMESGLVGAGDGARADKTKGEKEVVWDKGTVVYVEFAGVTGMKERLVEMKEVAEKQGLGFIGVRAEDVYDVELEQRLAGGEAGILSKSDHTSHASSSNPPDNLTRLQTLLVSLPPASRPSLLSQILDHLISLTARALPNVSHILSGETSTREAQRVISATATGRGWALPLELSGTFTLPSEHEEDRIMRLKPMKEISLKEAAIYSHLRRLTTMNERRWVDSRSSGGRGKGSTSLEMLTEQFILGLSVTHPSTVSTINKTGDKLVFSGDSKSANLCPLCQMPAEPSAKAWKSRTALTVLPNKSSSNNIITKPVENWSKSELDSMLCYACLTTMASHTTHQRAGLEDPGATPEMPLWVTEGMTRRKVVSTEEMRKGIEEFLI